MNQQKFGNQLESLKKRIAYLPDNWWEITGPGPCGPDTEMFYWAPNNIPAPKFIILIMKLVELE